MPFDVHNRPEMSAWEPDDPPRRMGRAIWVSLLITAVVAWAVWRAV